MVNFIVSPEIIRVKFDFWSFLQGILSKNSLPKSDVFLICFFFRMALLDAFFLWKLLVDEAMDLQIEGLIQRLISRSYVARVFDLGWVISCSILKV